MYRTPIWISAQALIITPSWEIILEDNKKIGKLSFIGGKLENKDRDEDRKKQALNTVVREVGEEFEMLFERERFLVPHIQPITKFWTGLWKSTYFVLWVTHEEVQKILQNNTDMWVYSEEQLREELLDRIPIRPKRFFKQLQRAKAVCNQWYIWNSQN